MAAPVVRFAPSPTGVLHVGNARTALINWLFARGRNGTFILRIDDTDRARSSRDHEDAIRQDLAWLGLDWDQTFRQSERLALYAAAADRLRAAGYLYACYETADELERQRRQQRARGKPPIYNRAALELSDADRIRLERAGCKPHWRFKLSGQRVDWHDLVRGQQSIDTASLSDPVLVRADGSWLYTLPSCVDDAQTGVTHVVRGEDHVTNSAVQVEIFRALGITVPQMAHTPLLVDTDGAALSKRLGSLSIDNLRARHIEPLAISSLLGRVGTSDETGLFRSMQALATAFDLGCIGRAPTRFAIDELERLNATLVHEMPFSTVRERLWAIDPCASDARFWTLVRENCNTVEDAARFVPVVFGTIVPCIADKDHDFIKQAARLLPEGEVTVQTWGVWIRALQAETGRRGRKLFMPLRKALTGMDHGPDVGRLIALMGRERLAERLGAGG